MKVFLSYGMNGVSEEDQKFMKAFLTRLVQVMFADEEELEIISNEGMKGGPGNGHLYYLGGAIQKMDECDVVIFSPSALNYRGCYIEYCVAEEYRRLSILTSFKTIGFSNMEKLKLRPNLPISMIKQIIEENGGLDEIIGMHPMTFDNV